MHLWLRYDKNFCINYFVDSENLEIQEKNIFTATELVTLLPTFGREMYENLYANIRIYKHVKNVKHNINKNLFSL